MNYSITEPIDNLWINSTNYLSMDSINFSWINELPYFMDSMIYSMDQ